MCVDPDIEFVDTLSSTKIKGSREHRKKGPPTTPSFPLPPTIFAPTGAAAATLVVHENTTLPTVDNDIKDDIMTFSDKQFKNQMI